MAVQSEEDKTIRCDQEPHAVVCKPLTLLSSLKKFLMFYHLQLLLSFTVSLWFCDAAVLCTLPPCIAVQQYPQMENDIMAIFEGVVFGSQLVCSKEPLLLSLIR